MQVNMSLADPEQSNILGLPAIPPKITNVFAQALEFDKQGKHKEAAHIYNELLNADFDNPVILAALGINLITCEKNGLGALLLKQSLEKSKDMLEGFKRLGITPKAKDDKQSTLAEFVKMKRSEILNALGTAYKHENKTDIARHYFTQAQKGLPINPDIQNNLGTIYINEGKPERALEHLLAATNINPEHPQARWNQALAYLELGDYEKGWASYDYGFPANVRTERQYTNTPLPMWDGSPGKNVVVYGEQGIGDEILFASCLPDLIRMSKSVVFDCHKRLHTIFCNSFPNIDIYPTREDAIITWPLNPDDTPRYQFDARVAIGSLPKFFRPNLDAFPGLPYIKPSVEKEAAITARLHKLGPRPKIGISWIGGHKRTRVEVRSAQLEQLLPILKQDADFISLQYTDCLPEVAAFEAKHGIKIHHWPEILQAQDYDETAALVANLDLVITVCTSVVHLAGSMGVPTWVLTPSRPAWRYRLDLDYMPWYGKTVTLFRQQPTSVEWQPVIEEVAASLASLLKG